MEAIITNMGLLEFAKVVKCVADLKKPMTGGEEISHKVTGWKSIGISRIMKSSWNGLAFTCFIFCLSQHEKNGRECFCSMELAKDCARIRANVVRPKPFNLNKYIKNIEKEIVEDGKRLEVLENSARADPQARIFRR